MEIKEHITRLKLFYHSFLNYIENNNDTSESFLQIIKDNHFGDNPDELRSILHIIYKITSQHKRNSILIDKVQKIILHYESEIKQTFSNSEIFRIFRKDKLLLLFLIQHKIITVNEEIVLKIMDEIGRYYSNFFYPELKPFLESIKQKYQIAFYENQQITDENFEKMRQEGENNFYLCQLIRNDSIDKFIPYYNEQNLNPLQTIPRSIFETNIHLVKNSTTIIEYAAFFGSINIVRFLLNTGKNPPLNLWNFVIHSGSFEMIHLLEEKKIKPGNFLCERIFLTSVKCHHNKIAHYVIDTLLEEKDKQFIEEYFGYYNFEFFPDDFIDNFESIFEYSCHYDYVTFVKILINEQKIDLNKAISNFFI